MAGEDASSSGIGKFDGSDYAFWRMQIEDYLYGRKLHQPLSTKPADMAQDAWELLDRQVLGVIRLTLAKNVAHNVAKEKTTMDMMKALANMYEKPSANNKVLLMKRLFQLKMTESGSVAMHLNEFNTIVNSLESVEISFDDEIQALILLASLPNSWEPMRAAVSNSVGNQKLVLSDIRDRILNEEVRRVNSGEASSSAVLNVENRGRSNQRNTNKNRGRSKSTNGKGSSSGSRHHSPFVPKKVECWNCGKTGHISKHCWSPRNKEERRGGETNVAAVDTSDMLLLAVDTPMESWILDSGASFHTTPNRETLENYSAGNYGRVYLADGQPLDIVGIGDVTLRMPNGQVWKINKVRHVPSLLRNLISIGQLDDEDYGVNFRGGQWVVSKGSMTMARGFKHGTLYMTTSCPDMIAAAADTAKKSELWHHRLGHMSENGMKQLVKVNKIPELSSVEEQLCESCILGKQKRVKFSIAGRELKKERLELVHTDVWGPTTVSSLGGSRYYVTFIDDSTRKVWVYFMKFKSEVYEIFKKWRAMVENETGLKVKSLLSDNGGEYTDAGFKRFCEENGIKMIRTIPGTPQQNGVAERMNRTLNERARSMRIHSGLPKTFWADAVNTAAYLINRGPSVPLEKQIPEEVWSGKKVTYSHLKVFGCLSYVHIDENARSKLDPKSKRCYFVGYGDTELGYRFWDEQARKIIRSRNVIFNEEVLYKDRSKDDSGAGISGIEKAAMVDLSDIPVNEVQQNVQPVDEVVVQAESQDSNVGGEVEVEPQTPIVAVRRSARTINPPQRFSPSLNYILLTDRGEPECYEEAEESEDSIQWESAMEDEMKSLVTNQTWKLTKLPSEKKALHNKWVYRMKEEHDGSVRYKARLVVKGFQQKEGVDYNEIFSPVVKMTTIRVVLGLVMNDDLYLHQMDVKTAFLHGDLEEEIYMLQPQGFEVKGKEDLVCKLQKSLYGLKQAPRQWYKKFDNFMKRNEFKRCEADHCCYIKRYGDSYIILLLYVDDMLIAGANMSEIDKLKSELSEEFEMKDLGEAKQILGMRITRCESVLKLSQEEYIKKVIKRFSMDDAKSVSTPLGTHFKLSKEQSPVTEDEMAYMDKVPYCSAVGSLMYAMVCTRPDIAHAVGVVSRFMCNPGIQHWEALKWILRYLKGTSEFGLCFRKSEYGLQGYVDADHGGDMDSRKSTTGYVYTFAGSAISWSSQLQKIVTLSSCEAEYVATTEAAKEMIWLQGFLKELDQNHKGSVLHCDSQSAIHLAKNPVYHARTKHIQFRYHFIREALEDGVLALEKISGNENPADMLTKVVPTEKLKLCRTSVALLE